MPPTLLERIRNAETFNQGFKAVSYTSSALVDLALHRHPDPAGIDISTFEAEECKRLGVPPEVGMVHRLPHFRHLFGSRYYAAGYYVYMWAEMLEAEAFNAFEDAGNVFDPGLAEKLERFIFSAGDSLDPRAAFRAFCGRDPQTTAMLRKKGLLAC
jgi:peptidyl-dipeptidase Dcp